jgi:hypothetical protein
MASTSHLDQFINYSQAQPTEQLCDMIKNDNVQEILDAQSKIIASCYNKEILIELLKTIFLQTVTFDKQYQRQIMEQQLTIQLRLRGSRLPLSAEMARYKSVLDAIMSR